MNSKILIIGSTGKLGSMLINYCKRNNLNVFCITCYKNKNKMTSQSKSLEIKNTFHLEDSNQKKLFINFLKNNKFKIIYFLDYGSFSLKYIDILLKNNSNSIFAIANKEMIIAGGNILINKIYRTKNSLIPLDSEHFSLQKIKLNNTEIKKVFITASGGPFYFKKKVKLNNVSLKSVLNHPKWDMGYNNSIDSSNFINKVLEMFELSTIYNINLKNIDFLVSENAYVHSIILYQDNTITLNCFNNNMLVPLIKPLTIYFNSKNLIINHSNLFDMKNFKLESFNDKRFKISSHLKKFMNLNHSQQINFMILNNKAHNLYINKKIKYSQIIDFIVENLFKDKKIVKLNSFNDILKYIYFLELKYENIS